VKSLALSQKLRHGSAASEVADMSDNVKVAVRVRPFNGREKGMKAKCIIRMGKKQTFITDPVSGEPSQPL
jgi:hypothetical protein